MKRSSKIAIAAAVVAALGTVGIAGTSYADKWRDGQRIQAHFDGDGPMGGMMGGKHGGRHGGMRQALQMFEDFDANGDGKLTQEEIDGSRAERLAKFDANGDGQLDLKEYEALWLEAMRERMVDRFQDLDADGDGQVTAAEFGEPFSKMVKYMDRNGDGSLSVDDRGPHRFGRDDDDQ